MFRGSIADCFYPRSKCIWIAKVWYNDAGTCTSFCHTINFRCGLLLILTHYPRCLSIVLWRDLRASRYLKSSEYHLFAYQVIHSPTLLALLAIIGGHSGTRWFPLTNDRQCGNVFAQCNHHGITVSGYTGWCSIIHQPEEICTAARVSTINDHWGKYSHNSDYFSCAIQGHRQSYYPVTKCICERLPSIDASRHRFGGSLFVS